MARRVGGRGALAGPVLALGAQALSLLADDDVRMMAVLSIAGREGFTPILSSVSIVEQRRTGKAGQRLRWLRSRLTVIDVDEELADAAGQLLNDTGLSGHECVVDSLVVATAATGVGPAKVVSSDGSHIPKLCSAASEGRLSPVDWVRV